MTADEQFFKSKVVIITGAAGFIGSNLAIRLARAGAQVIGIDNYLTGTDTNLETIEMQPNFEFYEIDVIQDDDLEDTLNEILDKYGRVDAVFHLASPASPPIYQDHPSETYLVNTWALHNLCTWLRIMTPRARLLFASTSEVYGDPQVHPQVESYWGNVNPNGLRSCYDEAKRLGETICGVFYREGVLDTRIVRIFNTYGPHMDLQDGRILPQFITEVIENKPLTIYGDGSQTRSYCYIDDLVEGLVRFMARDGMAGETINLGNPGEFTVLETAQIVNELVGRRDEQIEFKPLPADDPQRRRPDITKAKELLDWEPQVSFREGLQEMLEYYEVLDPLER